ncbi:helix-turn-helix transcriptional regulator [Burkholderia cenocepacia]|uniref:helix-turn-helix transcriptional regulator n=1 Tax=Burkholderia cenocepacia TaxID=95486 RepID=UPI0038B72521
MQPLQTTPNRAKELQWQAMPQPRSQPRRTSSRSLGAPGRCFTRWNDLKAFVPFSRETLRKRELEGRFPRRQHLSQRCAAWPNRELHRWFADPSGYRAEG